jgi:hypothetical protein
VSKARLVNLGAFCLINIRTKHLPAIAFLICLFGLSASAARADDYNITFNDNSVGPVTATITSSGSSNHNIVGQSAGIDSYVVNITEVGISSAQAINSNFIQYFGEPGAPSLIDHVSDTLAIDEYFQLASNSTTTGTNYITYTFTSYPPGGSNLYCGSNPSGTNCTVNENGAIQETLINNTYIGHDTLSFQSGLDSPAATPEPPSILLGITGIVALVVGQLLRAKNN